MKSNYLFSLLAAPALALGLTSCAGAWWDVSDSPYDYYYDPTFPPPPYYDPMPQRPIFYPGSLGSGPIYRPDRPVYLPDNRPIFPSGGNPGPALPPSNNIGNRRPAIHNGGINRPQTGSGSSINSTGGDIPQQTETPTGGNRRR